jgi:hypothetical protein
MKLVMRAILRQRTFLWVTFGVLSLVSGMALMLRPFSMATLYGLPQKRLLSQLIGARDVAIGAGLLASTEIRWFMWARSASEAFDAVLIGVDGVHTGQYWDAAWRIIVALLTSILAYTLARGVTEQARTSLG